MSCEQSCRGLPVRGEDTSGWSGPDGAGDPLLPLEWGQVSGDPAAMGRGWGCSDLHSRGSCGRLGAPLSPVQEPGIQLGMVFLDGTRVRVHQKAAGAARKGDLKLREMIVRRLAAGWVPSRPSWRVWATAAMIADGAGHINAFQIAPGQGWK